MESDFKRGRCGVAFKNGKFFEFTDRHVLVMTGGTDPRAWFKRRSHGWKATRKWADQCLVSIAELLPGRRVMPNRADLPPELPLELPLDVPVVEGAQGLPLWYRRNLYREHLAKLAYLDTIPGPVRTELARYRQRIWPLYNLLVRCPGALDLSQGNPALAFALASNWVFHKPAVKQPMRAAGGLVNRKQKVVLEWLGYPGTEAVRRLFAKIEPDALTIIGLLKLRAAIGDPERMKVLSHLRHVNAPAFELVVDNQYWRHVTPALIEEVAYAQPPRANAAGLLRDTLFMVREHDQDQVLRPFRSVARLQQVHDVLVFRRNRQWRMDEIPYGGTAGPEDFPPPPFKGTETIIPIRTISELGREGVEMRNCVGSYAGSVHSRHTYVYRVLAPIRATLSVVTGYNGNWQLGEVAMTGNAAVGAATREILYGQLINSDWHKFDTPSDPDKEGWMPFLVANDEAPTVVRCDLDLKDGEHAPAHWSARNPKQLPLWEPRKLKILQDVMRCFASTADAEAGEQLRRDI